MKRRITSTFISLCTILLKLRPVFHRRVSLVISLPSLSSDRVPKLAMYLIRPLFPCNAGYRRLAPLFRLSTWRYSERRTSKEGTPTWRTLPARRRELSRGEKLSRRNRDDSMRSLVAVRMMHGQSCTASRTWCGQTRQSVVTESHPICRELLARLI